MEYDTIAAIATPTGSGGIGIIKISGKNAFLIAEAIFQKSHALTDEDRPEDDALSFPLKSHRLYHGHIVNPDTGKVLDEVLLSAMKAPGTYTREDVIEINTHSGYIVMASVLGLVLQKGARLADPGEFTKRAYLNGRIDLTQAEAVIDIINSRTEKSLEIATSQIKGRLKNRIESMRHSLIDLLTQVEAAIDFPEDVGDVIDVGTVSKILEKEVIGELSGLVAQYENAHFLRDGLKMIVVGRPNVGKSSLMNRLIKDDRVIVTSIPGTTRDLIEETLNIRGIPVILADSAGLHETKDPVEVIGIEKTKKYIYDSDLVLFMIDASDLFTNEDQKIYQAIYDKRMILVINKIDLVNDDFEPEIPEAWSNIPCAKISALYGNGLSSLKDLIAKLAIGDHHIEIQNTIIPNLRHKNALEKSMELVVSANEEIRKGTSFELIAIDIKEALEKLGEIIGVVAKEDVIDQIFNQFCIGK
ncbi:MAG: tRNA uridine-5-carboxymethylaminomethyl(34) synthesis GTPase MnmE [Ignavibacteriaceae bacterium]|jgi:tRNA modification GTPase|nr:tRNA uridine-5-carboxymethylaminomethyl(34) synthesis GTPase MnmE [Ignavibacteriaceae bacterium]